MYQTEVLEDLTPEDVAEAVNAKAMEMERLGYRLVAMSFPEPERAVMVFRKGLKGSLL